MLANNVLLIVLRFLSFFFDLQLKMLYNGSFRNIYGEIDMVNNSEIKEAIEKIKNGHLTSIDLSANKMSDDVIRAIAEALKSPNCQLTSLYLRGSRGSRGSKISDAGARAIAEALKSPNCQLTSINLGWNEISDIGVCAIAEALQSLNCKLTSLDLCHNNIIVDPKNCTTR